MSTTTTKSQKAKAVNARDFDIRDMIGYALGDVGNNFTFNLVNSFLMIFYTNVFGLKAALVGALFMSARLVDAFVDIMVGRLIDNAKMTKRGRFTPWVMRMKFPLAASAILLFLPAAGHLPMTTRVIYAFVTYLAWGIFYSFVNIPYGSMASAISGKPRNKTSLSTARSIGSASGTAIVSYVVPLIMYGNNSHQINPHRFFMGAAVFAILGLFCYVALTMLTVERIRIDKTERVPLGKMFSEMAHNKARVMLVIIDIIVVINQNLSGVTLTYLFNDYFQNKTAMSIALVFNFTSHPRCAFRPSPGAEIRSERIRDGGLVLRRGRVRHHAHHPHPQPLGLPRRPVLRVAGCRCVQPHGVGLHHRCHRRSGGHVGGARGRRHLWRQLLRPQARSGHRRWYWWCHADDGRLPVLLAGRHGSV